jgi:predicted ArsR family transcriptional regulator
MLSRNQSLKPIEVEDVLCSRTRLKIIILLLHLGQLNVSDVAYKLRINYVATYRHLDLLENAGILKHREFGRVKQYRIDESSIRAAAVVALVKSWGRARPEMREARSKFS